MWNHVLRLDALIFQPLFDPGLEYTYLVLKHVGKDILTLLFFVSETLAGIFDSLVETLHCSLIQIQIVLELAHSVFFPKERSVSQERQGEGIGMLKVINQKVELQLILIGSALHRRAGAFNEV